MFLIILNSIRVHFFPNNVLRLPQVRFFINEKMPKLKAVGLNPCTVYWIFHIYLV